MLKFFFLDSASPLFQNQVFFLILQEVGNNEVAYFIGNIVTNEGVQTSSAIVQFVG